ncbi:DUF4124 domain-containing protein [Cognatiluteimonas profundi]|uniref:DUF4124 domain-containing protein n=1 Tax=Cognatiluteimonas profundi TaxID=2594501 RepID=UPI00131E374C|nr:DUF4124 domain-containing protein [Lysobacter profundi]
MRFPVVVVALLLATAAPVTRAVGEVTIYRCTDASGHLTLRDTPCRKGEKQQARTMIRPTDAPATPPAPAARARPVDDDAALQRQRTVYITPPRPLYECVTPDGAVYTSDSGEGNPRWVPLWTLGYPIARPRHGMTGDTDLAITDGRVRIDDHHTRLYPPLHGAAAWGAGTWVRDDCHALPQDEVCSRLVDRRDEIRRRFFNAMPSERDVLRVEERGINARLANDCGSD